MAAAFPLPCDPANSQFFLDVATPRMARSAELLSGMLSTVAQPRCLSSSAVSFSGTMRSSLSALKRLRTDLGRVYRDVGRKIAGNPAQHPRFARLLRLVERLLTRKPGDSDKLSRHAMSRPLRAQIPQHIASSGSCRLCA